MNQVHSGRTTKKDNYETPPELFSAINRVFRFSVDAAASEENHLCRNYFTEERSALEIQWTDRVWCNPPFSMKETFLEHGIGFRNNCEVIVFLLPGNSRETQWWRRYARQADQIINLSPRVNFNLSGESPKNERTGRSSGAGFPCCLLVFFPRLKAEYPEPSEIYWRWKD